MNLTPNKRIFLNIVATYGRSLFALACGLFAGRWTLMALGTVDYGLMGLVAGLTAFIQVFINLFAWAIARFYAVSVGQSIALGAEGLENCRQWFNLALLIHTVIPLGLMIVGYPLGEYAVRYWLTIPADRIEACIWVFRFVCISCLVGMVNVPFTAMYTAKQYFAELTIYGVVTPALNVCFLYYMVAHPGDWLVKFGLWTCLLSCIPQIVICLRAYTVFPECQFRWNYLWNWQRIKKLCNFAGWQFFGAAGLLFRTQGVAVLVNKYFGPAVNASVAISNTVAVQTDMLSSSMVQAFSPAIMNAYGMGDYNLMRRMAYRACKVGTLLTLLFALPLSLELPEILRIWLKNPPEYVAGLCWCVLASVVLDKLAVGHNLAVHAVGKIAAYQAVLGGGMILTLPIAWLWVALGGGVYFVGYAMILTMGFHTLGCVWFARKLVKMSARYWLYRIMLPLFGVGAFCGVIGFLPHFWMMPSFGRICVTTVITECMLLPLAWFFVLDGSERSFVQQRLILRKKRPLKA